MLINMKLIVGLGNPGTQYHTTRHNIGFMVIDSLAQKLGISLTVDKSFNAEVGTYKQGEESYIVAKPQTFMNKSGEAVQKISAFYKIAPSDIYVVHDDLDLELGAYKLSFSQNPAGHHGIESIISHLATKDFHRLRIGIANAQLHELRTISDINQRKDRIGDFVTSDFSAEDKAKLPDLIERLGSILISILDIKL